MRNAIAQDRFDCGWNDIVTGVCTASWTNSSKWTNALAWAIDMRSIAQECRLTCLSHMCPYYDGIIAACDHFEEDGEIVRHTRRSTMEINELVA